MSESANPVQAMEEVFAALPEGAKLNARALALAVAEAAACDCDENGFPRTGPGSWAQWKRRWERARVRGQAVSGVNCLHLSGVDMCDDCWAYFVEVRARHGLPPRLGGVSGTMAEVARRLATRV